jgi:hypothetical protein
MNINPPDREFLRALHSSDVSAVDLAIKLGETLLMSANALHRNPAALIRICQQINPESSPADAVTSVHEKLKALPSSVAVFAAQWKAVAQDLLTETSFLQKAVNERNDAIGYELRQLNAKLAGEAAQAKTKRKALIDAGVSADEAARLSPEPSETAHAEQAAALNTERAIYSEFGRTLDAALLPPAVHERAKELEVQKDWKIGVPQRVGA